MYSPQCVLFHLVQAMNMSPLLDHRVVFPRHLYDRRYDSLSLNIQICNVLEPKNKQVRLFIFTVPVCCSPLFLTNIVSETCMVIMIAMIGATIAAIVPAAPVSPITGSTATATPSAMVMIDVQITMRMSKASIHSTQKCGQNKNNLFGELVKIRRDTIFIDPIRH